MNKCNFWRKNKFIELFKTQDYKTNRTFSILKCHKCDLAFTSPRLSKKDLVKYYEGYRDNANKRFWSPIEKFIYFWHKRRVKHIEKLVDKGKILDVGCGRALELEMLKKHGWLTYATEFSEKLRGNLLKKGVHPFFCEIWQLRKKNNFFDVITLWHSLEHISDPAKVIKTSHRLLRKNGYLVIEVPNFGSFERKLFGQFWFHLDLPRHLYHFSKESLLKELKDNQFKIVEEKHVAPEYDFFSFWQGSLNKNFSRFPNVIYRFLLKDYKTGYFVMMIVLLQIPVLIFIIVISFFIVPIFWLNKQSGTIKITARKIS